MTKEQKDEIVESKKEIDKGLYIENKALNKGGFVMAKRKIVSLTNYVIADFFKEKYLSMGFNY